MLLSAVVVCESRIFSLSLLATVRGGTSFLCPKRQRNEAKKALSNQGRVSVPSVQAKSFWHLIARCSQDLRMFEPLLLANPDTNTLRPVRSRASTIAKESKWPHTYLRSRFLGGLALGLRAYIHASQPDADLLLQFLVSLLHGLDSYFRWIRPYAFLRPHFLAGWRRGPSCIQIRWLVVRG